ncbi:MAG: hypothetical protein AW07_02934 [Candidatus Accumulibacter sp. SK-11]|nr:MAG: hypothetical protein AW07_02934 [Candidatus Accumulibacter sp. SK-11]
MQTERVLRNDAQHQQDGVARSRIVLLLIRQHRRQIVRLRMIGGELLDRRQLLGGGIELVLRQLQPHDRRVRREVVRLHLDRLAVGRHRRGGIALGQQQVTLELPGFVQPRRVLQPAVEDRQRPGQIAAGGFQSRLADQRRRITRLRRQRRCIGCFRLLRLVLQQIGLANRCLQVSPGFGRGERGAGQILDHLVALAHHQQRTGKQRGGLFGRIVELLRLAQLDLGASRIAAREQRPGQQETGFGELLILLQGVLEVDHRRLVVVLLQRFLRLVQQIRRLLATTTADHE